MYTERERERTVNTRANMCQNAAGQRAPGTSALGRPP